jgi:glycosyltransferase involved in cell wall biosynthesis
MSTKVDKSIIVLVHRLGIGGAEKNCVIVCNELVIRNYHVELWITSSNNSHLLSLIDKRVKIVFVQAKRVREAYRPLKKLLVESKIKTILIFNIELLISAFIINKLNRLNYRIIARSISNMSSIYNERGFLNKKIWFTAIGYSLNRIEAIIAQSVGMKEDLIKNFNISASKITVIHNPSLNLKNNTNHQNSQSKRTNEILYVGRLTREKGLNYLLEAFQLAQKSIPDLKLTVVGFGEVETELQNRISELHLSNSISLAGFQTELLPYYKRAKATVLTSVYEGFPNVLVESISVGTPVIAFDCPSGPREIIIPEVNGILVDYLNVEKFAKAIVDIINGKVKFKEARIIESCSRFNLEGIMTQYEQLLLQSE